VSQHAMRSATHKKKRYAMEIKPTPEEIADHHIRRQYRPAVLPRRRPLSPLDGY
jgi:hypothetical protein